ncbi:MAG: TrmB family transcriptional regulator [archaeon]
MQKLGLTKYNSKALAYVVKNPECTAKDVSEGASIPYTKVYSVLDSLENMNFLNSGLGRPKRYVASDPEYIIGFLTRREKDRFEEVKKSADKALDAINSDSNN